LKYPESFIKECKNIYPEWIELHDRLDVGSMMVGKYLDDARQVSTVSSKIIDEILNAENLESLKEKARNYKARNDLYYQWCAIVGAQ
jgi:hypothetical protein